jgi:hypothetical protein
MISANITLYFNQQFSVNSLSSRSSVCSIPLTEYVHIETDGSSYDLKRIILGPIKLRKGQEVMVTIEKAKKALNKNGKSYTEEEVKKIKELFEFWAKQEYNKYQKNKQHEKRNTI